MYVCVCVCVCVHARQGINSNHAQTARFTDPTLLPLLQTMSSVSCPTVGRPKGPYSPCVQPPLTHHGSCPTNHPRCNKTPFRFYSGSPPPPSPRTLKDAWGRSVGSGRAHAHAMCVLLCVCVCVCVCCVCVCVCVCVKESIRICSNCEVQQS